MASTVLLPTHLASSLLLRIPASVVPLRIPGTFQHALASDPNPSLGSGVSPRIHMAHFLTSFRLLLKTGLTWPLFKIVPPSPTKSLILMTLCYKTIYLFVVFLVH